jgi:hypothetical protein
VAVGGQCGGAGRWFPDRDEAVKFARSVIASGRTNLDVGCFRINYYWHRGKFGDLDEMFDPPAGLAHENWQKICR